MIVTDKFTKLIDTDIVTATMNGTVYTVSVLVLYATVAFGRVTRSH